MWTCCWWARRVFVVDAKNWASAAEALGGKLRAGGEPRDEHAAKLLAVTKTAESAVASLGLSPVTVQQAYGRFGVVDGEVTLWDLVSGDVFPVPSDSVQLLLAGDGDPGDSIPRSCRT